MQKQHIIYIVGGAIIVVLLAIIGIGSFFIIPSLAASKAQATVSTPTAIPTRIPNPYTQPLKQYGPDIKNQIAQGLHLTVDQLTTQVQGGKTLSDIAKAQNITPDQLNTIVANAFQVGLKPALDGGTLTQKQVDTLVKRMQANPKMLDRFLGAPAKANA
ncbi:MAG TPA: hypothetical protein VKR06_09835 [Ktedonosporobacter sp.]|nr:hypothetical protein [Ktedonosporobacter sp.]